jgi:hypothetical protein
MHVVQIDVPVVSVSGAREAKNRSEGDASLFDERSKVKMFFVVGSSLHGRCFAVKQPSGSDGPSLIATNFRIYIIVTGNKQHIGSFKA